MAVGLNAGDVVLDVGCGISPDLPPYVKELRIENYFGLEPLTTPVARSFPCLSGAVAERVPLRNNCVDAAIFATSQDHIADIDKAMAEIRRVVKPDGKFYMWIGLYDPESILRTKTFYNLAFTGSKLKRVARFALVNLEYSYSLLKMLDRRRRLAKGLPIDRIHERWYTKDRVRESLSRWGLRSSRWLQIPEGRGAFIEAEVAEREGPRR